jgi:O-antigen ligase
MLLEFIPKQISKTHYIFVIGLCLVILSGWLPIFLGFRTFMFTWKVETASSIFLMMVAGYCLFNGNYSDIKISKHEKQFIILPLLTLTIWSGISAFWAFSWQSSLHHSAIWVQYIFFFIVVRQLLNSKGNYQLFITLLTTILILIGLPAIIEYCSFLYFNAGTTLGIRFSKYAEIINLLCPLLLAWVVRLKVRQFKIGIFVIAVLWLFVISTISRTGFILFIVGILAMTAVIFICKQFKKYRSKTIILLFALILIPVPIHLISLLSPDPNIPLAGRLNNSEGSNNSRKLLKTIAFEIIKTNPILGVGADNFGIRTNEFRMGYGEKNSDDVNLAVVEAEIPERTHNEYLQIVSELGIVGGIFFLIFLASIFLMTFKLIIKRNEASLFPFAALCGIWLFLISSGVSSYSFRLMQNGFVFFFVLALASKMLLANKKTIAPNNLLNLFNPGLAKFLSGVVIIACSFLAIHGVRRAISASYSTQLLNSTDVSQNLSLYQKAVSFDEENAIAYLTYGLSFIYQNKYQEAIVPLRNAIKYGEGTSATYSYLATAQYLSGDINSATETFAEACKLYPRSTFVRTRYAQFLQLSGKENEAQKQLDISFQIDPIATFTWWSLINEGVAKTNVKTLTDPNYMIVFDLQPQSSYQAFLIERFALHPKEKVTIKIPADN